MEERKGGEIETERQTKAWRDTQTETERDTEMEKDRDRNRQRQNRERERESQITEKTLPSENKSETLVFHT